ncbi:3,4-dihydroxy-2-butanone-4-phosphate synthase [Haliangium ochraceum]|uniref:3,4-dihydroxy-2-butanone 4-phosphate synthase n=1 Tax=Haliangium ochraceum (strain DSM 14365 / JCM 11303 / SMP-2) TaxID=502025 RepID=D0LW49_HALO1|nr:3,4-dihydroxy-2-butanone-4-phosphate synthase [Haliangium ochraceum]ACY15981.1 3,4-dihydroxy-2-butanone 4-phosphate synthase [Haliangium ochraceum DSM 14365]
MKSAIERVLRALDDIRDGKMVILVDDEDRENEGDLTMAAEAVTPEAINFMARYGRGLICLTLEERQIRQLKLPMMVSENQATLETAFTVSVEARHGVTTGISASDRATTIRAAIAADARPEDLVSPGHIFPLKARPGGVLVRTGQTEGSVDLARLAGLKPAGVICEIMRDDGEMARMPDLERFSEEHGVAIVSIADIIAYRLQRERIVRCLTSGPMRPAFLGPGEPFQCAIYGAQVEDTEYMALVRGDVAAAGAADEAVLVRVQSVSPVGDTFGVKPELAAALRTIDDAGVGVCLYVYNKARSSLEHDFRKHALREAIEPPAGGGAHSETLRDFGLGAQVLADLGCHKVRLLSNSSRRIAGIEGFGIEVVERVAIDIDGEGASPRPTLRSLPSSEPSSGESATGGDET